jgi:hypothetical protein
VTPIDVVNEFRLLSKRKVSYQSARGSSERYLQWCVKYDVEPLGFLRARAQLEYESGRPMPAINRMASVKLLEEGAWLELLDRYEGRMQVAKFQRDELAKAESRDMVALAACTPVQEKQRLLYASNRKLCSILYHRTGGFHPLSRQCSLCHEAVECQRNLNETHGFDLVGLRRARGTIGYPKVT